MGLSLNSYVSTGISLEEVAGSLQVLCSSKKGQNLFAPPDYQQTFPAVMKTFLQKKDSKKKRVLNIILLQGMSDNFQRLCTFLVCREANKYLYEIPAVKELTPRVAVFLDEAKVYCPPSYKHVRPTS